MTGPVWVFGEFELDAARFELRRAGARVAIQPKALDLLLYLARHPDGVVTKDEPLAALWPDATVTEASLSRAVNAARQALDDGGRSQRCIETVRGRGFRFVAPITPLAQADPGRRPSGTDKTESDSGFVGRAGILEEIAGAVAAAGRGEGSIVLLAGETGIGKTRTAHEARARARGARVGTVFGWCHEGEGAPALWPWVVALRELVASLDDTELREALGEESSPTGLPPARTPSATPTATGSATRASAATFNRDGLVNTTDARLTQRCAVDQIPCAGLCDASGDGVCNTTDARLVQRLAVGQLTKADLSCAERP